MLAGTTERKVIMSET